MQNNTAFVAISFHKKFKNVYDSAIKPAIENNGLKSLRANGEDVVLRDIYDDIAVKIEASKIVIVDLSRIYDYDGNLINLNNVYYELGLANGINKRCIFLAQNIDRDVPFDLRRLGGISYDPDDLTELKDELTEKISQALTEEPIRFFKNMDIVTEEMKDEFNYLKQKSKKITINICPPTADIFFNDKLLGQSPQTIYINAEETVRNTFSASASSFFEVHREITKEEIEKGEIIEKLDVFSVEGITQRVPTWLRYRNKDTKNPVLMRAISQYLYSLNTEEASKDAEKETHELLEIAPQWYLAYNQMGFVTRDDIDTSLYYYRIVTVMNPNSYLGYFNQACVFAKGGMYREAINILKNLEKRKILESYCFTQMRILKDDAFDKIQEDEKYGAIFIKLGKKIDEKAKRLKLELGYDC